MLTLRCTAKMLKYLGVKPDSTPAKSDTLLGDWFGNVFTVNMREYFIFTSSRVLISIVTEASDQLPLCKFIPKLQQLLSQYGVPQKRIDAELQAINQVSFGKTDNRSVIGSMNDFINTLKFLCDPQARVCDPTSPDVHYSLWECPMKALDGHYPASAALNIFEGRAPEEKRNKHIFFKGGKREINDLTLAKQDDKSAVSFTAISPDGSTREYGLEDAENRDSIDDVLEDLICAIDNNEAPIFTLREIVDSSNDPGGDLAWIAMHENRQNVYMYAVMLLFTVTEGDAIPEDVTELIRNGAIDILESTMHNPEIADERKVIAGPLLMRLGADVPEDEYASCFRDFKKAHEKFESSLPAITAKPECILSHFEALPFPMEPGAEFVNADDQSWRTIHSLCMRFKEKNSEAAAMFLGAACASAIWQRHENIGELLHAIDTFRDSNDPGVLWQLQLIAQWPFAGHYGDLAKDVALSIRSRGIKPHLSFFPEFSHGSLSMVDGNGARYCGLFYRTLEGGMDSVLFLPKDSFGMKDAFPTFTDSERIEGVFDNSDLCYCPCSLQFGREIFADAFARSIEYGNPVPPNAYFCRQYLGEDYLLPQRRTPNLGAYMLETHRRSADMVRNSAQLMDTLQFGGLWFAPQKAYDFISANLTGRKRKLPKKLFEQYVREICVAEKESLIQRIAANLEVESLAGRATHADNKLAVLTYIALSEDIVPFEEIPFIRELAEYSVQAIHENIRDGYSNKEEANLGALDHDDDIMGMFEEMLNPFGEW